jgi:Tol biopolymer transport system component
MMKRILATLAVSALSLCLAPHALAAFPGKNGVIAFTRNGQIAVMDAKGKNVKTLTHIKHGRCEAPQFSADGKWIVFDARKGGVFQIFKMRSDGSGLTQLTTGQQYEWAPGFSPSGDKVVYSHSAGTNGSLWTMDADGKHKQMLTSGGNNEWARYSPDGKRIAFGSTRSGEYDVFTIKPNGTGLTRLSLASTKEDYPEWRPNGKSLSFTTNYFPSSASQFDIYAQDPTQAQLPADWKPLITKHDASYNAAWSPDAKFMVYTGASRDIYKVNLSKGKRTKIGHQDGYGVDWQPL